MVTTIYHRVTITPEHPSEPHENKKLTDSKSVWEGGELVYFVFHPCTWTNGEKVNVYFFILKNPPVTLGKNIGKNVDVIRLGASSSEGHHVFHLGNEV